MKEPNEDFKDLLLWKNSTAKVHRADKNKLHRLERELDKCVAPGLHEVVPDTQRPHHPLWSRLWCIDPNPSRTSINPSLLLQLHCILLFLSLSSDRWGERCPEKEVLFVVTAAAMSVLSQGMRYLCVNSLTLFLTSMPPIPQRTPHHGLVTQLLSLPADCT